MTSAGRASFASLARRGDSVCDQPRRPIPADHQHPMKGGLIVGTRDGSLLYAQRVLSESDKVTVEIEDGITITGGKVGDIAALQSLGGGFEYLSDIENS